MGTLTLLDDRRGDFVETLESISSLSTAPRNRSFTTETSYRKKNEFRTLFLSRRVKPLW